MRKQRIPLKNGVDVALVRRHPVDFFSVEENISRTWLHKSANNAQRGCFATAGRSQKGHEFLIVNIQIDSLEDTLTVKLDHDIL